MQVGGRLHGAAAEKMAEGKGLAAPQADRDSADVADERAVQGAAAAIRENETVEGAGRAAVRVTGAGAEAGPSTPQRGGSQTGRLSTTPLRTPGSVHRLDLARDRRQLARLRDNDPNLTTLWLTDGELEEDALGELLAGLRSNTVLRSLYLHGKCLTAAAIEELVDALLQNNGARHRPRCRSLPLAPVSCFRAAFPNLEARVCPPQALQLRRSRASTCRLAPRTLPLRRALSPECQATLPCSSGSSRRGAEPAAVLSRGSPA